MIMKKFFLACGLLVSLGLFIGCDEDDNSDPATGDGQQGGGSSTIDCSKYANMKKASMEMAKVDENDCEAVRTAFLGLIVGCGQDGVIDGNKTFDDLNEGDFDALGKVMNACHESWGIGKERYEEMNEIIPDCFEDN